MKYYDTSALLRAWKEGWVPQSGMTRSHTISEWFHIMTGRGLVHDLPGGRTEKRALSWPLAASEVRRIVANLKFVDLSSSQALEALDDLAKMAGLKPSAVYDFMHIRAGEIGKATVLVTLNLSEWARMTKKRLEPPSKHPRAE